MNAQAPKRKKTTVSTRGPKYSTMPIDRVIKTYPVSEHELTTMGTLTFFATLFFAAGTGAVSFSIGLLLDVLQEADAQSKNVPLIQLIIGVLCLVGVPEKHDKSTCRISIRWGIGLEWQRLTTLVHVDLR